MLSQLAVALLLALRDVLLANVGTNRPVKNFIWFPFCRPTHIKLTIENIMVLTKPINKLTTALRKLTLRQLFKFNLRLPITIEATPLNIIIPPSRAGLSAIAGTARTMALPRTLTKNRALTLHLKNLYSIFIATEK